LMIGVNPVLNYKMLGKFSAILLFIFMSGCVTMKPGVVITDTPLNMSETRKVISTIIGQPIEISENGRDMYSQYYDSYGLDYELGKKDRFQTQVSILNDRRPYDIRVLVVVEERRGQQFVRVGHDKERSKKVADRIQRALNESRDNRNVIDDFKPF
jgi:hypothetical protein